MNRREVLQKTAAVLGFAVTGSTMIAFLEGCKAKPQLNYTPDFFNEDQAALISELCEVLIPKTDTPGAKEAGVPAFIDAMIKEVYKPESREAFVKAMAEFDKEANSFASLSPEEKVSFVTKKHGEAMEMLKNNDASWGWWRAADPSSKPFVLQVKELTMLGYFTSEPGATLALQYNQVPGPYQGCVPLAQVGKAWAN